MIVTIVLSKKQVAESAALGNDKTCGSWCFIGEVNRHREPPPYAPEQRGCLWGEIRRRMAVLLDDPQAGIART